MSHDLFRSVVRPEVQANGRRSTFAVSLVAHVVLLVLVVIAPLVAIDVLPSPQEAIGVFVLETAPPPAAPPPLGRAAARPQPQPGHPAAASPASYEAPDGIGEPVERASTAAIGDTAGPVGPGVPDGILGALDTAVPSPPSPPPPPPRLPRAGEGVRMPVKLVDVPPVYPRLARDVRREGTVVVEAIIGTDGVVREARVLRSVPLLDAAALDAVRQWRYQPTLLNGVPVPVIVTVTVVFRLQP